ncbi:MAG: aldose 1-epimerase family protein [Clostridia bacterium]|nr:aldose 1-epimerase family protein [Clostridia bacterium]
MIHYIENDYLKIGVKEFGCELTSVYGKKEQIEYLWQGNPDIWAGQSPILFPVVGRLIDDKYRLDGKEYTMPKHGFARKIKWDFLSADECSMTFILSETEETLAIYPYRFDIRVTFSVDKNKLSVSHDIINKNSKVMYFSLGAHPAFNCKIGDILTFDKNETLEAEKIDLVRSLRLPETFPVLKNERDIVITEDIFKEDALILHGIESEHITLHGTDKPGKLVFSLGNAPYLGIWAKPGAPYVCIEPWCGVNDSTEKKNDFSEKDGINALEAGNTFNYTWTAEFIA